MWVLRVRCSFTAALLVFYWHEQLFRRSVITSSLVHWFLYDLHNLYLYQLNMNAANDDIRHHNSYNFPWPSKLPLLVITSSHWISNDAFVSVQSYWTKNVYHINQQFIKSSVHDHVWGYVSEYDISFCDKTPPAMTKSPQKGKLNS